ncbi:MAG: TM2 domain-containing protein [Candidatus Poseidoniaceae archaeon]|nr:TM2 domain-containing protein [Candidatus Poseidoniaceae archaeon]
MDALAYFNNLKSQGYDDDAALSYTNQHYPDFKLNPVAIVDNYDDWFYQNFQQIAAECYPDNTGAIFTIASITENGEFIEVIAHSSPPIGYDPVRYDFSVSNGTPSLRHTFTSGPDGTWSPFFSTGNSDPQPIAVSLPPTVQSNSIHQAPQQVQTPQPQQMMGQYAPQQPMMQGQPMQAYGQQGMMQQVAKGSRTKIVTFLLAFFLGTLGVHNFYLGKTGLGIAQLLLTVLTLGIGALITGPWSFIEGILALVSSNFRDGDGLALSD